jgi:hypothetical protein
MKTASKNSSKIETTQLQTDKSPAGNMGLAKVGL